MPRKSSTPASNLPSHLETEVNWWREYLNSVGVSEEQASPLHVARFFCTDKMVRASIATRLSCHNALNQYYRERFDSNPFAANPYPYPLLKRYVPDFNTIYQKVLSLNKKLIPYGLLMLLGRFSKEDVAAFDVAKLNVNKGVLEHAGRCIPLKKRDATTIATYTKPTGKEITAALCGYRLLDLHSATVAYLFNAGASEELIMAIYGRQSAMKVDVAVCPLGVFRVRLDVWSYQSSSSGC